MKKLILLSLLSLFIVSCNSTVKDSTENTSINNTQNQDLSKVEDLNNDTWDNSLEPEKMSFMQCWDINPNETSYKPLFCLKSEGVYYSQDDKLKKFFKADPKSFKKYEWNFLNSSKTGYYYDKQYLYFHPNNWEWEQIKMDVQNINEIECENYFHDNNNYFYNDFDYNNYELW